MAMKKTNIPDTTSKKLIDEYLDTYSREYGRSDEVIEELFRHADNRDYYNILCRCGIIDLIYSTGIQRFNKGGIVTLAQHFYNHKDDIEERLQNNEIDYKLFNILANVDYSRVSSDIGAENRVFSFASKFLSFSKPDTYPIMDRYVKAVIAVPENIDYKDYCKAVLDYKKSKIDIYGKYSLKQADMFMWLWGKDRFSDKI